MLAPSQEAVEAIATAFVGRRKELDARAKLAARVAASAPITKPAPPNINKESAALSSPMRAPMLGHTSSLRVLTAAGALPLPPPTRSMSLAYVRK